jgi:MFS family permease
MFWDLEKEFNALYKKSSQGAKEIADAAIKEDYTEVEMPQSPRSKLGYRVRFQPVPVIFVIFGITTLGMFLGSLVALYFRPRWGQWSDLIIGIMIVISSLLYLILTIITLWLSDKASSRVNLFERREVQANLLVEQWMERKYNLDDLVLAFKSSLNTLKLRRDFYIGFTFTVGAFLTFFKLLIGNEDTLRKVLLSLTGISFQSPYTFLIGFAVIAVATFVYISAPIAWREQLEPFLYREIERRKAKLAAKGRTELPETALTEAAKLPPEAV